MLDFLNNLLSGLGSVVKALLLLVLAFIVASIVRSAVNKLISKTKLRDLLDRADGQMDGDSSKGTEYIGKLAYLLTFLLFVPGIFKYLGVESVASPILNLLQIIWGFLPNVLAAAIVLVVGELIARLVRQLLIPIFRNIKVDELQKKAGIEVTDSTRLSVTLAYIIYVLILIPVIVTALEALKVAVITDPAVSMLGVIFGFIPNIIVGIILIICGVLIGKLAGNIVRQLLAATGVDNKVKELAGDQFQKFTLSQTIGTVVYAAIVVFFVVQGCNVLKLQILSDIGTAIIAYMPSVLAAILIVIAALFASGVAEKALAKVGMSSYATLCKVAIMVIAAFMILNQLGIATRIVNAAFVIILAAVAVAFAVAFGIGGRDFAKKVLDDLYNRLHK